MGKKIIKSGIRDKKFSFKFYMLFVFLFLLIPQFTQAQYFGRNKIHYEDFDFKTIETDFFNVYYYTEEYEAAKDAARILERWNSRYTKIWGKPITKEQPVILYASHGDFQQTNVVSGFISQGTGGVTEGLKNRVTLPFTGIYQENDHVLGHELVHAFQYEILKSSRGGTSSQTPLWFIEGLAEYMSLGRKDPLTAMWMRDAVLNDDVPTIDDVSRNGKYFPYRYGQALWAYIAGKWGDNIIAPLFKAVCDSGFTDGIKDILKLKTDTLSTEWQNSIKATYQPQLEGKTKPDSLGTIIRSGKDEINLSPVASPDGKYIALITSIGLFTLDLYLVDASTGKSVKQLASSNTDKHFDAIRFINSAGAWSPDSKSFAFIVIEEGNDQIAIADVPSGEFKKEIKIPGVDEISHLAWSPDGNKILISGLKGGISDLYLYDLAAGSTEQITNDKYADLQPEWSPDGSKIIFSTDRGKGTDFDKLTYSNLKLGLMDLTTKNISLISISDSAKHINPQFSSDGQTIYFVSDPDGFSNIYSYSMGSNNFTKLTNTATGISGLTGTSPAISYSKESGKIIFTVFDKGDYKVSSINPAQISEDMSSNFNFSKAVSLPPLDSLANPIIENYLGSPSDGLPVSPSYKTESYSSGFGLLTVGQPYVGASVSSFGTAVGGGVSLYFGDILGDHLLGTSLQINGTLKDIGGEIFYMNQASRFNWGGSIAHVPYLTGYIYGSYDTVSYNGDLYLAEQDNFFRQRIFIDQSSILTQYPFSMNRRIEFSIGYTRYSYDYELETITYGPEITDEKKKQDAPPALNLFQASLAYAGDYSFFGFTSPVDGSRYRVEISPTIGSIDFVSILGDFRKYFFWNPLTFAIRGLHYGRYLGDADDNRLSPLQVGYDTWVRGYNINSYDITECTDIGSNGKCPEINRLLGSRVAIFNLELRVPLFGTEQFGLINFGFLPVELGAFLDGGVAWTHNQAPVIKFSQSSMERIPVFSAGFTARINLFGYIVGEVYYAFPFQRPAHKDGMFGFNLAPGW